MEEVSFKCYAVLLIDPIAFQNREARRWRELADLYFQHRFSPSSLTAGFVPLLTRGAANARHSVVRHAKKWGSQSWLPPAFSRRELRRKSRLKRRLRAGLPAPHNLREFGLTAASP